MMTASVISSPGTSTTEATPTSTAAETDHPGRWVGGAIGALVSLAAAGVAGAIDARGAIFDWSSWAMIPLLGIPIGFVLGRHLLPSARSDGWPRAVWVGMLFGWAAPPLGAIEILAGSRLLELGNLSSSMGGPVALVLFPIAIPISFLAIFITIPVGLAWGVVVRLVPDKLFEALRVPDPLDRLGVRHALALVSVALLALELAIRS
jgi:hypothetical protein